MQGIKLLTFILPRDSGNRLFELCSREGISVSLLMHGRGCADSEISAMLGAIDPLKDVMLITVDSERADCILSTFSEELGLDRPGGGIAFSIPLSAAASQMWSLELLKGGPQANGEQRKTHGAGRFFGRRRNGSN